jgi:hypothetical protein
LRLVGGIGQGLRKWRNHADYNLGEAPQGGWSTGATTALGRAKELIGLLDKPEEAPRVADRQKLKKQRAELTSKVAVGLG